MNEQQKKAKSALSSEIISLWKDMFFGSLFFVLGFCMIFIKIDNEQTEEENLFYWFLKEIWSWPIGSLILILSGYTFYIGISRIKKLYGWLVLNYNNEKHLFYKAKIVDHWNSSRKDSTLIIDVPSHHLTLEVDYSDREGVSFTKRHNSRLR